MRKRRVRQDGMDRPGVPPRGGVAAAIRRGFERLLGGGLIAVLAVSIYGTVRHFGGIVALSGAVSACAGAAAAAAAFLLFLWAARLPARWIVPAAMLLAFGLRAAWMMRVPTEPVYDFRTMAEAALAAARGDFAPLRSDYFQLWTYQVPFVLYEAALLRLFGPDLTVLKWANTVVLALLPAVGYALGRTAAEGWTGRKTERREAGSAREGAAADGAAEAAREVAARAEAAGKLAALLIAVAPSTVMMAGVLTNQHLAALFLFAGLAVWPKALRRLRAGRYPSAFLMSAAAGALFAVGDLIRPLGAVFVAAALGGVGIAGGDGAVGVASSGGRPPSARGSSGRRSLSRRPVGRRAGAGRLAKAALGFLLVLVFFALRWGVSAGLLAAGVTDRPLGNHEPLWKFVAGLNRETTGHFSRADYEAVMGLPAGEARTAFERTLIAERLRAPGLGAFFMEKAAYLWGFPDQAPIWSGWAPPKPVLAAALAFERALFLLAALGLAAFGRLGRPEIGPGAAVLALFLLGYAAVHLVIEIQVRYRYDALPALLALGAVGWTKIRRK